MNTISLIKPPRRSADVNALRRAIGWLPTASRPDQPPLLDDLSPVSPPTIATAAQRLLCAISDWAPSELKALSPRSRVLRSHGYKMYSRQFGDEGYVVLVLRASAPAAVELQTLIAYPDRRGHGSASMRELCRLADELGVDIWLDALPFGDDRTPMPLRRLKEFYRRFAFFAVAAARPEWISGYHRWDRTGFTDLMLRRPRVSESSPSAS